MRVVVTMCTSLSVGEDEMSDTTEGSGAEGVLRRMGQLNIARHAGRASFLRGRKRAVDLRLNDSVGGISMAIMAMSSFDELV